MKEIKITMNQAEVSKLVSKLRMNIKPEHRRLKNLKGPEGRIDKLRKTVTGLIKFERIELNINRGDEARQYAERVTALFIQTFSVVEYYHSFAYYDK